MITITTVLKTGNYYNHTWVDKMKRSLDRHMTVPFKFLPLSDSIHPFPVNTFIQNQPGYWNKIELFRPNLYTGPTLFIDADNVIIGDLSPMILALKGQEFIMYKSRITSTHPNPTPSSCVMYWERDMSYIWDIWNSQPHEKWRIEYQKNDSTGRRGDQGFIREHAKNLKLLHDVYPEANHSIKFVSGKKQPVLRNVSMLVFAGRKKPHISSWDIVKKEWQND